MQKVVLFLSSILASIALSSAYPQWPYRDNMESYYYGYQGNNNNQKTYRGVIEDDDDEEQQSGYRQDLQFASGQSPSNAVVVSDTQPSAQSAQVASADKKPVQVLETGSPKPIPSNLNANTKNQAQQPHVANPASSSGSTPAQQPPAFPPAVQPSPPSNTEDSEEEDSDEEEEADDNENENDNEENEEEESEEEDRRRNEPIATKDSKIVPANNLTSKVAESVEEPESVENIKPNTIEALVPGYVTDQGEVLVPFDTVTGAGDKRRPITIIPDTSSPFVSGTGPPPSPLVVTPPVVVKPKIPSIDSVAPPKDIPSFFRSDKNQYYYSDSPPPGSIFTFDDDDNEVPASSFRQEETESEEDQDDTTQEEDTEAETEDDVSDESSEDDAEDTDSKPSQPPLAFVKATGPSGEDDEAESLGIAIKRGRQGYDFPGSRSPTIFAIVPYSNEYRNRYQYGSRPAQNYNRPGQYYNRPSYNGFRPPQYENRYHQSQYYQRPHRPSYNSQYRPNYNQYNRPNRPHTNRPSYSPYTSSPDSESEYSYPTSSTQFYYRPITQKEKRTKVIPVANFDLSVTQDLDSGEITPKITPIYYNNKKVNVKKPQPVIRRRPVNPPGGNPNLFAVYHGADTRYGPVDSRYEGFPGFTPVIRQRSNLNRQAKQLKSSKTNKNKSTNNEKMKKEQVDPLGILYKVNKKNSNSKVKA